MSLTPSRSASVRAPNVRNHQLRTSPGLLVAPLIICFHGSGSDPLPSWDNLIATLVKSYRVLLLDRGSENPTPEEDFPVMLDYLRLHELNPPYVLVAHSYGGAFAKLFLHRRLKDVAGLVLVETGQEGGLSVEVRQFLNKRYALGDCPIVVIRGNSLIKHWKDLRVSEVAAESQEEKQRLRHRRHPPLLRQQNARRPKRNHRRPQKTRNPLAHIPNLTRPLTLHIRPVLHTRCDFKTVVRMAAEERVCGCESDCEVEEAGV